MSGTLGFTLPRDRRCSSGNGANRRKTESEQKRRPPVRKRLHISFRLSHCNCQRLRTRTILGKRREASHEGPRRAKTAIDTCVSSGTRSRTILSGTFDGRPGAPPPTVYAIRRVRRGTYQEGAKQWSKRRCSDTPRRFPPPADTFPTDRPSPGGSRGPPH